MAQEQGRRILSVTQLNEISRVLLESAFPSIWVQGEVSNFQAAGSGHWYFTLKDETAQLRCAMFRGRNLRAPLRPAHGDSLLVRGTISIYAARGEYQMIVEEIEAAGFGALQRALEALKRRLAAEGLFDAARKRALPSFPSHIGLITSRRGAVLHDVLTVLRRRFPALAVTLFPVPVQGEGAAAQIARAIELANRLGPTLDPPLEALLLARGGGSLEDLWAFNEEPVLRAIHASRLPLVCGVGHETDVTLADLVADVRAPTPSAAAELLSPDRAELLARLMTQRQRLTMVQARRLQRERERLAWLARRLRHPGARLREQAQRLDEIELRLRGCMRRHLAHRNSQLVGLRARLRSQAPHTRVRLALERLHLARRRLGAALAGTLQQREQRLTVSARLLDTVSPLATLARGYAIVSDAAGHVLRDAATTIPGTHVRARLAHGALNCTVDAVEPEAQSRNQ